MHAVVLKSSNAYNRLALKRLNLWQSEYTCMVCDRDVITLSMFRNLYQFVKGSKVFMESNITVTSEKT